MDALRQFKLPSTVPQDLILIQDLIGDLPVEQNTFTGESNGIKKEPPSMESFDDDESSDSEEEEVVNLVLRDDDAHERRSNASGPSRSATESHSSDSSDLDDSDAETAPGDDGNVINKQQERNGDDDDDLGDSGAANAVIKTEHEVTDYVINVPDISEVGADEQLEAVGRIINVADNVVIIQGSDAPDTSKANQRALDSDTLLVFEDRKVLGYIHEPFGPTHQPLYQVRFSQAYPLDSEKVQVSRPVFHVPQRSKFVFVNELRHLKGSDASNAHDEEPGEEEMEFSDDEQEAEHKRRLKQKRLESRGQSAAPPSRHATPTASQLRDQDLAADLSYGSNPYDEYSPYNVESTASQARMAPLPYDDPYSDAYDLGPMIPTDTPRSSSSVPSSSSHEQRDTRGRGRGRGQNAKFGRESNGRGRGSRREKPNRDRGRGRQRGGHDGTRDLQHHQPFGDHHAAEYDPRAPRPQSPTSMAIARATGQYIDGSSYASQTNSDTGSNAGSNDYWTYQQQYQQPSLHQGNHAAYGYQQSYVQPHINPRFASAYGYQFNGMPSSQYGQYGSYGTGANSGSGQSGNGNGGWGNYGGPYNQSDT